MSVWYCPEQDSIAVFMWHDSFGWYRYDQKTDKWVAAHKPWKLKAWMGPFDE